MQPSENMKPRAVLMKSAPTQSAHAARAEVTSLPEATRRMRSFSPIRRARRRRAAGLLDRQAHVVEERLRRGAAAALAAVDHEEVGA
jgi:hypothetical protein